MLSLLNRSPITYTIKGAESANSGAATRIRSFAGITTPIRAKSVRDLTIHELQQQPGLALKKPGNRRWLLESSASFGWRLRPDERQLDRSARSINSFQSSERGTYHFALTCGIAHHTDRASKWVGDTGHPRRSDNTRKRWQH